MPRTPLDRALKQRLGYARQSIDYQISNNRIDTVDRSIRKLCEEDIVPRITADNAIYFAATLRKLVQYFKHFGSALSTHDRFQAGALRVRLEDLGKLSKIRSELHQICRQRIVQILSVYKQKDIISSNDLTDIPLEQRVQQRVDAILSRGSEHFGKLQRPRGSGDDDDIIEIIVDGQSEGSAPARSSWLCPLTMEPIEIPARTLSCRHRECFDLRNLVEQVSCKVATRFDDESRYHYPDKKRLMRCPRCSERFEWDEVAVDWDAWERMPHCSRESIPKKPE